MLGLIMMLAVTSNPANMPVDLAILGGGASGLLVLWHALHAPNPPRTLCWINTTEQWAHGPAYSTRCTQHLLNVRASGMSALPDQPNHFVEWLASDAGLEATTRSTGRTTPYGATEFAPRMVYGAYLDHFLAQIEALAHACGSTVHRVSDTVQTISHSHAGYQLHCTVQTIAATRLVLATGNHMVPPWAGLQHPRFLGSVWYAAAQQNTPALTPSHLPAVIIGSGLTAVDGVLWLRAAGWQGTITLISGHQLLPQPHTAVPTPPAAPAWQPPTTHRLSEWLRRFRAYARTVQEQCGAWQPAIDALRPNTIAMWQSLPPQQQRRFMKRLAPWWNTHRHRMAPEIYAALQHELASGGVQLHCARVQQLAPTDTHITLQLHHLQTTLDAAYVLDATGPTLNPHQQPALARLLVDGTLPMTANGYGIATDATGIVTSAPHPLGVIGCLRTGNDLESTAMPELRGQAQRLAYALFG